MISMSNYHNVSIIVATDQNLAIGKENTIPWHLRNDLQHFKELTTGKTIIMGRNTFASLNYKKLPNRLSVVITSDPTIATKYEVETHTSLAEALKAHEQESEIMIIGGGKIYAEAIDIANKLYLTRVHTAVQNPDVYFPHYEARFSLIKEESFKADQQNDFDYDFCELEAIS